MRRVMIVMIVAAVAALAVLAFYRLRRDVALQPAPTEQSIDQLLDRVRFASQRARSLQSDFEYVDTDGTTERQKCTRPFQPVPCICSWETNPLREPRITPDGGAFSLENRGNWRS